jgi:hypothetical protein
MRNCASRIGAPKNFIRSMAGSTNCDDDEDEAMDSGGRGGSELELLMDRG